MTGDDDLDLKPRPVDEILDGNVPAEPFPDVVDDIEQPKTAAAPPKAEPVAPDPSDDEEDRRRTQVERRIEALERHRAPAQLPPRPDTYEDPEGAKQWDAAMANERAFQSACNLSETLGTQS